VCGGVISTRTRLVLRRVDANELRSIEIVVLDVLLNAGCY
jgi:hypothetical protein